MKDESNKFIKVRENWHKHRAMILSADRLNILISTKGTDVKSKAKTISVEDVEEVSLGMSQDIATWAKLKKRTIGKDIAEDRAFSIRFKDTVRIAPLYMIAQDVNTARAWVEGLRRINEKVSGMSSAQRHTWWLWDRFKAADKDGNGELEEREVKKFFKSINLEMNENSFNDLFAKYDTDRTNRYFNSTHMKDHHTMCGRNSYAYFYL